MNIVIGQPFGPTSTGLDWASEIDLVGDEWTWEFNDLVVR